MSTESDWDDGERELLEEGLVCFPPHAVSNMTLYIKIAAMLPRKNVRDVATAIRARQENQKAAAAAGRLTQKRQRSSSFQQKQQQQQAQAEEAVLAAEAASGYEVAAAASAAAAAVVSMTRAARMPDPALQAKINALVAENMGLLMTVRDNIMVGRVAENYA
ncbi:unnamed protein product, partial [Phaeothamnion confervicola]